MMKEHDFLAADRDAWDATQTERADKSPTFSAPSGSRRVSIRDGIRVEAIPSRQEGSIRVVAGPLATVGDDSGGRPSPFSPF